MVPLSVTMPPVTVVPSSVNIWPLSTVSWVLPSASFSMLPVPDISMVPALVIAPPLSATPLSVSVLVGVDMDGAAVGDDAAGDGGAVQRQYLAAVDRQLGVAERVVLDAAGAGYLDGAGIGDRAAGERHAAERQRLGRVDMDGAAVGDDAAGHRGAVQRQGLAAVDRQLGVAEHVVLDAAGAGDLDVPALVIAPPLSATPLSFSVLAASTWMVPLSVIDAAGDRGAVQRQRLAAVDGQLGVAERIVLDAAGAGYLDGAGIGDRAAASATPLSVSVLVASTWMVPLSVMMPPVTVVPSSVNVWPLSIVSWALPRSSFSMLPVPVISMVPALVIAPPLSATPLSVSVLAASTWTVPVSVRCRR